MHSFSKEYSVPCSNESIQITMEKMTLIFCWTSLKAACPILCLFWSVSLHHLCLVLNRLDTIRDSSTPDPVFKLNSTERQTLCSLRGKGKKIIELSLFPAHLYFLKPSTWYESGTLHMNRNSGHKRSCLSIALLSHIWEVTSRQYIRTHKLSSKHLRKTTETNTGHLWSAKPSAKMPHSQSWVIKPSTVLQILKVYCSSGVSFWHTTYSL